MIWISDDAMARLVSLPELPDFSGTRYRLIGELDRGGMGVVYAAEDLSLAREVAIKVIRDGLGHAGVTERLEREARILAGLEHPGIVPVHDAGFLPDGRAWYVMKRVRGARVDAIARSGLTLAEALRLFTRICEPVAFAHARGVVHRDLKPENVMVGEFGEVLIMDWGVAKLLDVESAMPFTHPTSQESRDDVTQAPPAPPAPLRRIAVRRELSADGDVIGTRGYMAPEQERGETAAISPRTDVWALGAILRDLAATACARDGVRVPRPVAAIVAKATADAPRDRYASAVELSADVVRFVDGTSVKAYREPPWERVVRWLRKNKTAVAVVAAYLVMRTVIYLWFGR